MHHGEEDKGFPPRLGLRSRLEQIQGLEVRLAELQLSSSFVCKQMLQNCNSSSTSFSPSRLHLLPADPEPRPLLSGGGRRQQRANSAAALAFPMHQSETF